MKDHVETQIFITLGGGVDLSINKDDHLVILDRAGYRIDLGLATHKRLEELKDYIGRLQIHAVEEKVI